MILLQNSNIKQIIYRILKLIVIISLTGLLLFTVLYYRETGRDSSVTVFILDTELDEANFLGHGQLVYRIISNNAPHTEIVTLDVGENEHPSSSLYQKALAEIISFKQDNPQQKILVNISLAFSRPERQAELIKRLEEMGVVVVAAAGNDNSDQPLYPAGFEATVAVASADREGKNKFSNYGEHISLSASGSVHHSSVFYHLGQRLFRQYEFFGTSYSAPRVTGVLAAILEQRPDLNPEEALQIVHQTAIPIDDQLYENNQLGDGLLDQRAALARAVPEYRFLYFFQSLALASIALFSLFYFWRKFSFLALMVFFLAWLVLFPLAILFGQRLLANLVLVPAGQNIILIFIVLALVVKMSGWSSKFLIKIFLSYALVYALLGEIFPAGYYVWLLPIGLLLLFEIVLYILLKYKTNNWLLIFGLDDKSRYLDKKARQKLINMSSLRLKNLLYYCCGQQRREEIYVQKVIPLVKDKIKPFLFQLLVSPKYREREFAYRGLQQYSSGEVIDSLLKYLKKKKGSKEQILRLLAEFGPSAVKAVPVVRKIFVEGEKMWLRYQALKTLVALQEDSPKKLLPLLNKAKNDEQELVRMEAEYHYQRLTK